MLIGLRSLWEGAPAPPPIPVIGEVPPSVSVSWTIGGKPSKRQPRKLPVYARPSEGPFFWGPEYVEIEDEEEFLALLGIDFD